MPTNKQRLSVNLTDNEYSELSALAGKHDISMAWIGRKAILEFLDKYRENSLQLPLVFAEREERPEWVTGGSR